MKVVRLNQADFRGVAETVLRAGRPFAFEAHGNSMSPFIRDGDLVYLKPCSRYRVGDVVLSGTEHGVVLHRIVRMTSGQVVTRGDAAGREDPPVAVTDLLGRVYRLTGQGYTFHLHRPYSYLLATRLFGVRLRGSVVMRKAGKIIARVLG